jgi:hypothetical protein
MNELQRLQDWYRAQCNEDGEHSFGVTIDTLDNPGWIIKIDLAETTLDGKFFEPVSRGDSNPIMIGLAANRNPGNLLAAAAPTI